MGLGLVCLLGSGLYLSAETVSDPTKWYPTNPGDQSLPWEDVPTYRDPITYDGKFSDPSGKFDCSESTGDCKFSEGGRTYIINEPTAGYKAVPGYITRTLAHSDCRDVTITAGGRDHFIPSRDRDIEWSSFVSDLTPPDVNTRLCFPCGDGFEDTFGRGKDGVCDTGITGPEGYCDGIPVASGAGCSGTFVPICKDEPAEHCANCEADHGNPNTLDPCPNCPALNNYNIGLPDTVNFPETSPKAPFNVATVACPWGYNGTVSKTCSIVGIWNPGHTSNCTLKVCSADTNGTVPRQCSVGNTDHGFTSIGRCTHDDNTGSCSAECVNGNFVWNNDCKNNCSAQTDFSRGARYACAVGSTIDGAAPRAGTCAEKGWCTATCSDGTVTFNNNCDVYRDCAADTNGSGDTLCNMSAANHGDWPSGTCASGEGSCSAECYDGGFRNWNNTCTVTAPPTCRTQDNQTDCNNFGGCWWGTYNDYCDLTDQIEPCASGACGNADLQTACNKLDSNICDYSAGSCYVGPGYSAEAWRDFCIDDPRDANCGNLILDAGEECDGGANCTGSCTCPAGYESNGSGGCNVITCAGIVESTACGDAPISGANHGVRSYGTCPGACSGEVSAYCGDSGVFSSIVDTCAVVGPVTCPEQTTMDVNAVNVYYPETSAGLTVNGVCPPGYEDPGPPRPCSDAGVWGSMVGECELITECPALTVSTGCGDVVLPTTSVSTPRSVSCPSGCSGTVRADCDASGNFINVTEDCKNDCAARSFDYCGMSNVFSMSTESDGYDSATLACPAGMTGTGMVFTCDDGTWVDNGGCSCATCPNGVVDPGEECDDTSDPGCSDTTCKCIEPIYQPTGSGSCEIKECSAETINVPACGASVTLPAGYDLGDPVSVLCPGTCVGSVTASCGLVSGNPEFQSVDYSACTLCGNSDVDAGEECDSSANCTEACTCDTGYVSSGGNCVENACPALSNGTTDTPCGNVTLPKTGAGVTANPGCPGTCVGDLYATCQAGSRTFGTVTNTCTLCGNSDVDAGEECDSSDASCDSSTCTCADGYTFSGGACVPVGSDDCSEQYFEYCGKWNAFLMTEQSAGYTSVESCPDYMSGGGNLTFTCNAGTWDVSGDCGTCVYQCINPPANAILCDDDDQDLSEVLDSKIVGNENTECTSGRKCEYYCDWWRDDMPDNSYAQYGNQCLDHCGNGACEPELGEDEWYCPDDCRECLVDSDCPVFNLCQKPKCIRHDVTGKLMCTTYEKDCADDNPCTKDQCNPLSGCDHEQLRAVSGCPDTNPPPGTPSCDDDEIVACKGGSGTDCACCPICGDTIYDAQCNLESCICPEDAFECIANLPSYVMMHFQLYTVYDGSSCGCVRLSVRKTMGEGCFDPDTMIQMSDKSWKKASELFDGDKVYNPVLDIDIAIESIVIGPEEKPMIEVGFDDNVIKITDGHPLMTADGLKRAKDLTLDDRLIDDKGKKRKITTLQTLDRKPGQMVINLKLDIPEGLDKDLHMINANGIVSGDFELQNKLSPKDK